MSNGFCSPPLGKEEIEVPPSALPARGADRYHRSIGRSSAAKGLFFAQPNPFKFASRVRKRSVERAKTGKTEQGDGDRERFARSPHCRVRAAVKRHRRYLKHIINSLSSKKNSAKKSVRFSLDARQLYFYFLVARQGATRSATRSSLMRDAR